LGTHFLGKAPALRETGASRARRKTDMRYLFDTNILLKNPALLRDYSRNAVISKTVFDELDYRKKFHVHQENAQLAIKHINKFKIEILARSDNIQNTSNDEMIVLEAKSKTGTVIVSDDEGLSVHARYYGVSCISLIDFQRRMLSSRDIPSETDLLVYTMVKENKYREVKNIIHKNSFNPNFIGEDNLTPLIYFIRNKRFDEMNFWSKLPGVNLDKYDTGKFPMPPYSHAAQRGWLKGVRYLLESGANPHLLSSGKNKGNSALLIAVWDGQIEIVKYLLENKKFEISINQADGNGFTPLIKAAIKGHLEIAQYLLHQRGIDLLIRDREGKSAYEYALEKCHTEIADLIKGAMNDFKTYG